MLKGVVLIFIVVVATIVGLVTYFGVFYDSTDYTFREFTAVAVKHESNVLMKTGSGYLKNHYQITFSNGQVLHSENSKYNWVTYKKCYEGQCFRVVTRQPIFGSGPSEIRHVHVMDVIPCEDVTSNIDMWSNWDTECAE